MPASAERFNKPQARHQFRLFAHCWRRSYTANDEKTVQQQMHGRICPLCHEVYVSRATGHQLDLLLEPFHGKLGHIPGLPPAEVTIDFGAATAAKAA